MSRLPSLLVNLYMRTDASPSTVVWEKNVNFRYHPHVSKPLPGAVPKLQCAIFGRTPAHEQCWDPEMNVFQMSPMTTKEYKKNEKVSSLIYETAVCAMD